MTDIIVKSPGDDIDVTINWLNLGSGVSLSTVAHTVPTPLNKIGETQNTVAGTSTVRISGGVHGKVYEIIGVATLNNGRTLQRAVPVRVLNA